jgi:hypothetical protein
MVCWVIWIWWYFYVRNKILSRQLAKKHEEFKNYLQYYNHFHTTDDIDNYIQNLDIINSTLELCLENNFQDLAIHLLKSNGDIDKGPESRFTKAAIRSNSLKVLQHVWESNFEYFTKRKTVIYNYTMRSSLSNKTRKSFNLNNLLTYHQNKQKSKNFSISHIINHYCQARTTKHIIAEVMKWKYLEFDKELLTTLFTNLCFNEVYALMWKKTRNTWTFTKEQFKIVINNGEQMDLILYFLKIRECRLVLDEFDVQKKIVKYYMK